MEKLLFLKKIKNFLQAIFDRDASMLLANPHRDWVLVTSIFLFSAFVFAGIGTYLFVETNRGEIFIIEKKTSPIETIDVKKLQAVVDENEKQKEALDRLLENRPRVVDPSL